MSTIQRPARKQLLHEMSTSIQLGNNRNSILHSRLVNRSFEKSSNPIASRPKTPISGESFGSPILSKFRSNAIRGGAAEILNHSPYVKTEGSDNSTDYSNSLYRERRFRSPDAYTRSSPETPYIRSESVTANHSNTEKPAFLSLNINSASNENLRKSLAGIGNIGNSCYMACILQCLSYCEKFIAEFTRSNLTPQINNNSQLQGRFALKFCEFVDAMRFRSQISPMPIKNLISQVFSIYKGYEQQDACEFFRAILEILHDDLNRVIEKPPYMDLSQLNSSDIKKLTKLWWNYSLSRDDSVITDYFQGQSVSTMTCTSCRNKSVTCDSFQNLALELPNNGSTTLAACFEFHTRITSILESYKCEKCKKLNSCYQQTYIWRSPSILVIQLKRFAIINNTKTKLSTSIEIPDSLNLAPYTHPSQPSSLQYSLSSIVHHLGSLDSGHYVR
jgi:ubiquitin C-terminal hydrolase